MSDDVTSEKSWFERLSSVLLGEPKDREQLITLLRDAQDRDLLDQEALNMIEGALHVSEMEVCEIMIPRKKMVVIPKEATYKEIINIVIKSQHSRFPVIGEGKDEVMGMLLAKDLLHYQIDASALERFNIRDQLRPVVFIPESKRLNTLLYEFRKSRNHMAMVVDEYGSVVGLVTIEDVLEQIVGDIEDEHDIDEASFIRQHNKYTYTVQALTPIGKFNTYFKAALSDEDFDTIGGLVMQAFGHLPTRGESVNIGNLTFTVQRANKRNIQILRVNLPES
mgnify:CR=1 FL=1